MVKVTCDICGETITKQMVKMPNGGCQLGLKAPADKPQVFVGVLVKDANGKNGDICNPCMVKVVKEALDAPPPAPAAVAVAPVAVAVPVAPAAVAAPVVPTTEVK